MTHMAALPCVLFDDQARNHYVVSVRKRCHHLFFSQPRVEATLVFVAYPAASVDELAHNPPRPFAQAVGRDRILTLLATRLPQLHFIKKARTARLHKTTMGLWTSNTYGIARSHRPKEFQ
jgi:hypothetical protein